MQLLTVIPDLATFVVSFVDQVPEEKDVKAGWIAFVVFACLVVAVVFLGFSLTKQLRKVEESAQAGVYGPVDEPAADPAPSGSAPSGSAPTGSQGEADRPDGQV